MRAGLPATGKHCKGVWEQNRHDKGKEAADGTCYASGETWMSLQVATWKASQVQDPTNLIHLVPVGYASLEQDCLLANGSCVQQIPLASQNAAG